MGKNARVFITWALDEEVKSQLLKPDGHNHVLSCKKSTRFSLLYATTKFLLTLSQFTRPQTPDPSCCLHSCLGPACPIEASRCRSCRDLLKLKPLKDRKGSRSEVEKAKGGFP